MVKVRLLLPVLLLAALACSAVHAVTIGEVKSSYTDGASVFVRGVVTYITPAECYIQRADRSAGIWAEADTTGLVLGDEVYLTGDIATRNSERIIQRTYVTKTGYSIPAKPLAMLNRNLGGAPLGLQPGLDDRRSLRVPSGNGWTQDWQWFPAAGPNNIGVLVKAWGTVRAVSQSATDGTKWFHIDDGSHVISDLGDWGVLVYSDAPVKQGDQVTVTGISSLEPCIDKPEKMIRVLRTRSADDVQVTKAAEVLTAPFSDEFDSPVLGPRWAYDKRCGSVSASSNPGSVRLVMPENGGWGPRLICRPTFIDNLHPIGRSLRVTAVFSQDIGVEQGVYFYYTNSPFADPTDRGGLEAPVVGIWRRPEGTVFIGAYENIRQVNTDTIDVTLSDGISISYPGATSPLVVKGTSSGMFLCMTVESVNNTSSGRPFSACLDYYRETPIQY